MKRKKLLLLLVSTCLILALAVSPFMAACAKPAVEPGAAEIAALEKEVASLEKKVTAAEKGKTTSEKEVAALEKEVAAVEKEIAAAEKEIAKLEAAAPEPAKQYKWRLQSYVTSTTPHGVSFVKYFQPTIEELSQGQIEVTWYDEGAICAAKEIAGALKAGVVDMGHIAGGHVSGLLGPVAKFFGGGPFALQTANELLTFYYVLGMEDLVRRVYEPHDIYFIGPTGATTSGKIISAVPVETLADLSGLKMRCYGIQADLMEKIGVATCYIPASELYTGLATGVVDAAIYAGPTTNLAYGFQEVAKYWLEPGTYCGLSNVCIRSSLWEELPSDLKSAVKMASYMWLTRWLQDSRYEDIASYRTIIDDYGVTVTWLSEEDQATIRAAAMEIWDEVAGDDPMAMEAVGIVKDYLKALGRM